MKRLWIFLVAVFVVGLESSYAEQPFVALYSTTNASQKEVAWSTEPGIRYVLQECTNLASNDWTTIDGFPSEASALAQQHLIELNADGRFYRALVLDEQPPKIEGRNPDNGDFGVRRFSAVTIELADAGEIDPASISLLLGSNSTYIVASSELSWSNNVLTLDLGGDIALGDYGETQTVALAVSDILGNTTNYTWSFELEQQITTASNTFIFGSPTAQRAGQQLSGMSATLAARFGGPVRMSGTTQEWEISSVTSNEIVLAYTTTAPSFSVGQLLANLAPTRINEIFYRRIDSITDDATNSLLHLQTTEVSLPEILTDGSFTLGEDAVYLEVDGNGNLVSAVNIDATFALPTIGSDLSGEDLWNSGPLTLALEEAKFLYSSRLKASLEIKFGAVQRFSASASGDLDISCIPTLTLSESYSKSLEKELWDWEYWIWTTAGPVPVGIQLQAGITANASLEIASSAQLRTGFRQTASMGVEGVYVKDAVPAVTWDRHFNVSPLEKVPFTYTLNGNGELEISLVPQIDVRVYGVAGLYINTDPRVNLSGSATMVNNELTQAEWLLGAYADLNAGLSVIGFETGSLPSLPPFRLFTAEWGDQYSPSTTPLAISRQPISQNSRVGDPVAFSVQVQGGTGAYGYQWLFNGKELPGKNGNTLELHQINDGYVGNYSVRVTSASESVVSDLASLNIIDGLSTGPNYLFDSFIGSSYTGWSYWYYSSYGSSYVRTENGSLHIKRSGAGGSGGGRGVERSVNIPVTSSRRVRFDVYPVSSSVRNGTGDGNGEYPAKLQLVLVTPNGDRYLEFAYSQISTYKPDRVWSTGYQVSHTYVSGWRRGETFRIHDYFPSATKIKIIRLVGTGWDFESYFDNVEIY